MSVVKPKIKQSHQPIVARKISQGTNENSKYRTSKLPEARENVCDQIPIGLRFESDWLRKWCEFT